MRRSVGANRGEVAPATIDAFNAWLAREHGAVMAFMKARPERYGDPAELDRDPMFAAPAPVVGGFWEKGNGWTRRDPGAVALAA
ncbi:hypothetical protein MesoLjLc_51220 [Mesorhizobium sp. L-8-10]|uniref:hypothetical protein n=1 Tax=Mesorhizobium sp. L-8-10 TaxID=2744523 RepID=UPI0019259EB8|nr:hypothetical protein [Mesorhizobium sp. L-8-10]BCH33192.1 hypothetical protein MesoLjLc_51220 [Mesorhizobium sp. L-8-10]